MQKIKQKRPQMNVMSWLLLIGFFVYIIILFFPMVWGVYTSFKTPHNFIEDPIGLPQRWTFGNYTTVFNEFTFDQIKNGQKVELLLGGMYVNSLVYAIGTSFISTATCCAVAYVTSVFKWKFSKFINSLVLVIMLVPIVGSLPAQLNLMRSLHLYNTIPGIYISSFSFTSMNYLIFYAAFEQLPRGFIEAGKIDGASNLRIFLQLMIPMVFGVFFTLLLQAFIAKWNDYQTSMVWLPSYPTVAQGIWVFSFSTDATLSNVPMKLTSCMFLLLPIMAIFLIFHKKLLVNVTMGGLKE